MQQPGSEDRLSWASVWVKWSVLSLLALTVLSIAVGFFWLPTAQRDFSARGVWDSICRAAGVPSAWTSSKDVRSGPASTQVVLTRAMTHEGSSDAVGRGATLALNCTMCHGPLGLSTSDAPNLAGQYSEVIIKQLHDYKSGERSSSLMQSLARGLSDKDIADLAAYFAYLPKARTSPTTYDESLPALVRVGDPLRNIAPCISCHGQVEQKIGAPWLEGMPRSYLIGQLSAFRSGARRNDGEAQMRNVARSMSSDEIAEVAYFYARKAPPGRQ
jgi:cytochrome c553